MIVSLSHSLATAPPWSCLSSELVGTEQMSSPEPLTVTEEGAGTCSESEEKGQTDWQERDICSRAETRQGKEIKQKEKALKWGEGGSGPLGHVGTA